MSDAIPPRMPPLPESEMDAAQLKAVKALMSGPRGRVAGPFIAMTRSPEFLERAQSLGAYLRYDSALEPRLSELAILLTSRHWKQNFEFAVHRPIALKAGVAQSTVTAIINCHTPENLPEDEALIYEAVMVLFEHKTFDDDLYGRLVEAFDEKGVIDLMGVVGYYAMLAMILNVTRTALPEGVKPCFPDP